ncbi:unnamed protein product [Echinostoma caproni]|uniref:GPI transamidase component PIG-S n=1 Tax=Echinostoma caproni TaxID=27848 RepID=A0A183B2R6_9TREM|nr:unnamed protein product [Echinostoma caproni]
MTKQLPPSTAYEITVTVLTNADETRDNGNNNNNASATSWHAQLLRDPTVWLQDHVQSAFRSWLPYVDIQFFSQRLHAVNIEHLQPSYISADRKYRYYAQSDVSTLVNHLESYLGAPQAASAATRDLAGTKPGLHLILSVAMPSGTTPPNCPDPLRFHLPSAWSPFTLTNVAVVPQWGGLFFVDAPDPCTRGPSDSTAPEDVKLAHQLISVIRVLLGLPDRKPDLQNLVELRSTGIISTRRNFHTQLDGWFLRRTIESLLSIKVTMTSLVDLLSRFPNMVINDHVAHEVTRSTQVWAQTLDALANARTGPNHTSIHFGTVFLSAQDALESVNSAFFDHSLLGRLYFQEDQKYGIYVPLFLPIGFGILSSTKTAFRILFPRES